MYAHAFTCLCVHTYARTHKHHNTHTYTLSLALTHSTREECLWQGKRTPWDNVAA